MPPRPQLTLPTPGSRRAVVLGAGSFGTAVAVLLARGGFRTTLQTRSTEQAERLETERQNQAYLPDVEFPRELRVEPMSAGLSRADYVFLGVPVARALAGDRQPPGRRPAGAHAGDLDGQGPRPARRAVADDAAQPGLRRRPRRLPRRSRPRARDGHRGRRPGRRLLQRPPRGRDRQRLHARRRRLRAVQRPGRRRALRRGQERRLAGRGRDRRPGPERRRRRRRATSSPRSGATPSARAASRSR